MKGILLTVSAIALATGVFNVLERNAHVDNSIPAHIHTLYSKWTVKYGALRETPSEHDFRLRVFYRTHLDIQEIRKNMPSAQFALNAFADMTMEEFASNMLGAESEPADEEDLNEQDSLTQFNKFSYKAPMVTPPAAYIVPGQRPVLSQGMCGSCWAWAAKHLTQDALGGSVEVSAQNIMNCNKEGRDCAGGWTEKGFASIQTYGYRLEQEEPYRGRPTSCKGASPKRVPKSGRHFSRITSENDVKKTIFGYKTSVGIKVQAENQTWKSFRGGLFATTDATCRHPKTNHAVTLVGWDNNRNAWKLRNSWGNRWGEQGYAWLQINKDFSSPGNCYCGSKKGDINCVLTFWQ